MIKRFGIFFIISGRVVMVAKVTINGLAIFFNFVLAIEEVLCQL